MTNRRRSGRKAASTSKKETPEKSRRSSRRRGHKKSDSEPEADDSVSDRSFEEQSQLDVDPLALTRNEASANDGNKGEESGGSDGAWQVRSENGNKGGIPKLKLCLQRPADMSSPTSDTLPSPRTRRSRRGATDSPSKPENSEEHVIEEASGSVDGEMERRSTRLRRNVEKKEDDVEKNQDDDPEEVKKAAEEAAVKQKALEDEERKKQEEKEAKEVKEAAAKALEDKKLKEQEARRVEELEKESRRKVEADAAKAAAAAEEQQRVAELKRAEQEKQEALDLQTQAESRVTVEKAETKVIDECEVVGDSGRKQRSPSRDSSEERAKEAALRSRKAKQKEESSEAHTPTFPTRNGGRIRTTGLDDSASAKENHQEGSGVVRKRRWGISSSSNVKPVAISTDILKEIIPEGKIVPLSEVKLSPNRDEDMEVAVEENVEPKRTPAPKRRHSLPSDESEKDYEEEGVESGGEEMVKKRTPVATNHIDEAPKKTIQNDVRKVVVAETSLNDLKQRSPSPPKHAASNILYITNLVRPFTVVQLRDLLARTGNIVPEKGFWIDGIKSRCYVKYTSEEDAKATRHALHRIQWPASNPKQLTVDFGTEEDMLSAIEGNRARSPPKRVVTEERKDRDRDRERHRVDEDRKRLSDGPSRIVNDERTDKPSRTVRKVTVPVREWDVGKTERGISPPVHETKHFDDERRKRERDRHRRSSSTEPTRKIKRKDETANKVLLDELFRKTKATPCIYWLPLTSHQQALKEEMRRKHMEEHEKQLAEHRKRREAKGDTQVRRTPTK